MLDSILADITIHKALVLVVPAMMILEYALNQTPQCPGWLRIWILLGIGIIAGIFGIGFTVNGIANGIIATGISMAALQLIKQTLNRY
ncbi:phage holin family protein [Brevibacillus fluminis]|uniref:phage holin family protein n=1 Tax=Brevibacillus fluminis TaxID=511487 RepID=UPI003F8A22E1